MVRQQRALLMELALAWLLGRALVLVPLPAALVLPRAPGSQPLWWQRQWGPLVGQPLVQEPEWVLLGQ